MFDVFIVCMNPFISSTLLCMKFILYVEFVFIFIFRCLSIRVCLFIETAFTGPCLLQLGLYFECWTICIVLYVGTWVLVSIYVLFWCFRKIANNDYLLRHVCLVCPSARYNWDSNWTEFSRNLIFEHFLKIC
jgi:hypothetical protein